MLLETVFLLLAGILFIGVLGEVIFRKTNIPDVIWLLVIGIIIGPVLNWTSYLALKDVAPFFTTFALIFLLFEAGINIDIHEFFRSASRGMRLSISSFILSAAVTFGICMALGKGFIISLLAGTILAGVSSAVVLPIINNMEISKKTKISLVFDSALSDVLCILGTVTLIEIFTAATAIDSMGVARNMLSSFLIPLAFGGFAALLWNKILLKLENHQYILTLAVMLIVYSLSQMFGGNGAIACLMFGLLLGNSKKIVGLFKKVEQKKHSITRAGREAYSEVAFFMKTFFYVYLGILINFSEPLSFVWACLILLGLYMVRPLAVFLSTRKDTPVSEVKIMETLIPKGLAAAVLIQLPIEAGIPGAESLVNITLGVILISIVLSSVFIYFIKHDFYKGIFPFLHKKYLKK